MGNLSRGWKWLILIVLGVIAFLLPPPLNWIMSFAVGWQIGSLVREGEDG